MPSPTYPRRLFPSILILFAALLLPFGALGFDGVIEQNCTERFAEEILSLRDAYRTVQYGDLSRGLPWGASLDQQILSPLFEGILRGGRGQEKQSVLGTEATRTSTLVPYLVENLRGLSCRLEQICAVVKDSLQQGKGESVFPARPLGCSRLNLLRNRFYVQHPLRGYDLQFKECVPTVSDASNPQQEGVTAQPQISPLVSNCRGLSASVLEEEQAMLRSVVSYDAMQRGLRQLFIPLQSLLSSAARELVAPVRQLVESLGTLHAIPCLQPHCD
jgi:hypothetical protein